MKGTNRNISSMNRAGGGGGDGGKNKKGKGKGKNNKKGGNGKGLSRYYSNKEWWDLSREKQDEIRALRQQKQAAKRNASAVETDDSDSNKRARTDDHAGESGSSSTGDQMSRRN